MTGKIAFFDIDGTLTSELDGSIPADAAAAIAKARQNGNLMFINTGRCFQNVGRCFREIGWDGYVCGCGTNIYCDGKDVLHVAQTHSTIMQLLRAARQIDIDILFESRTFVAFDLSRPLHHTDAIRQYNSFVNHHYNMSEDLENPNFFATNLLSGIRRSLNSKRFASSATNGLIVLIVAAHSANLFPMGTPRQPESSMY